MKNKNFVSFFIIFCASFIGAVIAGQCGFWKLVYKYDVSYLSFVILFLYFCGSVFLGWLTYMLDKNELFNDDLTKYLKIPEFLADNFTLLGLLSTLIGFCLMFSIAMTYTDTQQIINQLKVGISTALYPSIVGIVASLLTHLQIFIIRHNNE